MNVPLLLRSSFLFRHSSPKHIKFSRSDVGFMVRGSFYVTLNFREQIARNGIEPQEAHDIYEAVSVTVLFFSKDQYYSHCELY